MKDPIDCALRTMSLRRKLHSIEARKRKYPDNNEGRKRFISDSLNKYRLMRIVFGLLIVFGAIGFISVSIFTIENETFVDSQYELAFLSALISMAFMIIGLYGCDELHKREKS